MNAYLLACKRVLDRQNWTDMVERKHGKRVVVIEWATEEQDQYLLIQIGFVKSVEVIVG